MILYATWWQWGIALLVYLVNIFSQTITLHRYVSHGSWKCNTWIARLLVIISSIGMVSSALSWAATHGKHHKHADTEQDPHSPTHKGFAKIWLLMLSDPEIKYATKLLRDKFYIWQHNYYYAIVLAYVAVLYLISPFSVVYAFLTPAALYWLAVSCLNYFGHDQNGPRNTNAINTLLALSGEGYQYDHHARPINNKYGKYDLGYVIIRLIEKKDTA